MKVGFIGTGNMGSALARAVRRTSYAEVLLYDKSEDKAQVLASDIGAVATDLATLAKEANIIFLGVKPNILPFVLRDLAPFFRGRPDLTLISMAAGVAISKIEEALGFKAPIIRIMPNTPVAYGRGMILYSASENVAPPALSQFEKILECAGTLDRINETQIDAGSAISGCGPAFAYMFLEALADGGVAAGLPRDKALLYAAHMLEGAAVTALESGEHPGALKDAVCSPGGSTIEGVVTLEEGGFRGTVSDAVIAAYEKTVALGK